MDRYDLALLTLLRTLLSRRGSAVLADRTGLPGAVAEILAEKTDDDIRGILLSAHRLAAGSADRMSLLGELACLLPELSESMMRSAPKESAPAPDPYALVLSSDGDISAEVRERILKGDITKLVINYSLNCRNSPFQNLPGLREVNFPIAAGPLCASLDGLFFRCRELVSVRSIDFGKAKSAQCLFWCCGNLRAAPECDVSGLTDANSMFEQCQRLREARSLNFAQARDVHSMFRGCSLLENVSGLRMPEAADAHSLFEGCVHLAEVPDLGIRKGADVRDIFRGCIRLQNRKV